MHNCILKVHRHTRTHIKPHTPVQKGADAHEVTSVHMGAAVDFLVMASHLL